jgi:hypothetical protein
MARKTNKKVATRSAAAAAKRLKYASNRSKGMTQRNALRRAGYHPTSTRSATAMAGRIVRKLDDHDGLVEALGAAKIDFAMVARRIKAGLTSKDVRISGNTLALLGQWMGWGRPPREKEEDRTPPLPIDTILAVRDHIAARLDAARTRRDASQP